MNPAVLGESSGNFCLCLLLSEQEVSGKALRYKGRCPYLKSRGHREMHSLKGRDPPECTRPPDPSLPCPDAIMGISWGHLPALIPKRQLVGAPPLRWGSGESVGSFTTDQAPDKRTLSQGHTPQPNAERKCVRHLHVRNDCLPQRNTD